MWPLLPARLSYPEIIPAAYHARVLYRDHQDLVAKLKRRICQTAEYNDLRRALSKEMAKFAWPNLIDRYDQALEKLASMHVRHR